MISDSVSKYVDPSCFCEVEGVHCMGTWETKGMCGRDLGLRRQP